jgi:ABC-type sugar transport system ATPase subunit
MYARLGFSVAAHVDPDVLIVDEVLSVGDYLFQQKCLNRMNEVISGGATVLFVSHNLKSVAEFCKQCLLLEHGHMMMIGSTQDVISAYVNRSRSAQLAADHSKSVVISRVTVRDEHGECLRFQSGKKAWIDIELTAYRRCNKLQVSLYFTDDHQQSVFDTSTERLGHGNFTLDQGDVFTCTFELSMNLGKGIYQLQISAYRYDTETAYDRWQPATTIHVSSDEGVGGVANCFPIVTRYEIHTAQEIAVVGAGESNRKCDSD